MTSHGQGDQGGGVRVGRWGPWMGYALRVAAGEGSEIMGGGGGGGNDGQQRLLARHDPQPVPHLWVGRNRPPRLLLDKKLLCGELTGTPLSHRCHTPT